MGICRVEISPVRGDAPPQSLVLQGTGTVGSLPDEIPAAEFEALLPHLLAELANRWYKLEENIVCPRPDGVDQTRGFTCFSPGRAL
jgi:hypothetical protein